MSLEIAQDFQCTGSEGQDWWRWSVWIEGSDEDLDRISAVEYFLHSTFPNPVQRRTDRSTQFKLSTSGWGEFRLCAKIHLKDRSDPVELSRWIRLSEDAPSRGVEEPEETAEKELKVLVSFGAADSELGEKVSEQLKRAGMTVLRPDDDVSDVPFSTRFDELIKQATSVVAVTGSSGSSWVEREVRRALEHLIPVVQIAVGPESEKLQGLEVAQLIRLKSGEELEAGVSDLAERMKATNPIG